MDRSIDSIGSCSLDADIDPSDVSDVSGSLHFSMPVLVQDFSNAFTSNITERCADQPSIMPTQPNSSFSKSNDSFITSINECPEKKPSYLNLACCVNGYSNLTTYDSKIRQDINKSREVSPLRPSASSIQICKKENSLPAPVLHDLTNESNKSTSNECGILCNTSNNENIHTITSNQIYGGNCIKPQEDHICKSFIQQRVEKLYGPAALAQGFYSSKKQHNCQKPYSDIEFNFDASTLLATSQKFLESNGRSDGISNNKTERNSLLETKNVSVDLPVLRHLSLEFRAQLPAISPKKHVQTFLIKKNLSQTSESPKLLETNDIMHKFHSDNLNMMTEISPQPVKKSWNDLSTEELTKISVDYTTPYVPLKRDGHFFLEQLKNEQTRLLSLANQAERYIETLSETPEISEDVLGFLRSASGKARLLVSQKLKQFEGLCIKNINFSPEDKFPTTADDLQGFWDMVNLQIDHIDMLFQDIKLLECHEWKKSIADIKTDSRAKQTRNNIPKLKVGFDNANKSKDTTSMSATALKREIQRQKLLEIKRKNKQAMADLNAVDKNLNSNSIEIFFKDRN